MERTADIAVVGAGAAGLTAAIFAKQAEPDAHVVLLDGARRVGAKILVAGGGRCNVTHHAVDAADYNGPRNVVKNVLKAFTAEDTVAWMQSLGVELKREETGKLFPTTDSARTVLDALLGRMQALGVPLLTEHRVTDVMHAPAADRPFRILHQGPGGMLPARRLILCTGGRSLPKTGSDGLGYQLVRKLGHTTTDTHPALVSMVLQQHFFHRDLQGLSHEAELHTLVDAKPTDRRRGSLLWTHFGVSGPLAMDASRHWLAAKHAGKEVQWLLCLLPGQTYDTLAPALLQATTDQPRATCRQLLTTHYTLPDKLADALLGFTGIPPTLQLAQLSKSQRKTLVHALVALPLPVEQDRGWNHAEVTAGGVPLSEVSWRTMASRICPGLHLAGEILDVDGRIGGFNFQWAWASGHLAGRAAAAEVAAAELSARLQPGVGLA
ncbi:MAG: NAD(P)/FAD-dependent oxidoreductase [Phycisphaerae bacterium]